MRETTSGEGEAMKLVVFDCDGTIVDSQHGILAAMHQAFASRGLAPPARERVLEVVGLSLSTAILRLLPEPDVALADWLAEAYKASFAELRQSPAHCEPLFPGARETIAALAGRGDLMLGVATGKSRRGVDVLFEREDLGRYFMTIQTADTHPSKPHPAMVHEAIAEAGVLALDTVIVGDTTFDVEMARLAGTGAVGVTWGYHPAAHLAAAGAHALVDSYAELPEALDNLFRRLEAAE
jgi:phosphoglycolate phosphatase